MFAVSSITFNGDGDNIVHKSARYRKYDPNEQRVYINKTQYPPSPRKTTSSTSAAIKC
jgi:hypothetical protein